MAFETLLAECDEMVANWQIARTNVVPPVFAKCSRKIPELERWLVQASGSRAWPPKVVSQQSKAVTIPAPDGKPLLMLVNYQAYSTPAAHALWIMRGPGESSAWSIFNSNGKDHLETLVYGEAGGSGPDIYFRVGRGATIPPEEVMARHAWVTPDKNINSASDSANPGFCGIFGLVAASYFYKNAVVDPDPHWPGRWQDILRKLAGPDVDPSRDDSAATKLGQTALCMVHKGRDMGVIVEAINAALDRIAPKSFKYFAAQGEPVGDPEEEAPPSARSLSPGRGLAREAPSPPAVATSPPRKRARSTKSSRTPASARSRRTPRASSQSPGRSPSKPPAPKRRTGPRSWHIAHSIPMADLGGGEGAGRSGARRSRAQRRARRSRARRSGARRSGARRSRARRSRARRSRARRSGARRSGARRSGARRS